MDHIAQISQGRSTDESMFDGQLFYHHRHRLLCFFRCCTGHLLKLSGFCLSEIGEEDNEKDLHPGLSVRK